jgi:CheY-like chemotaxis protein
MQSANIQPGRSVMVVEDEALVRMMAVDMFEQAGFHVLEAESAEEAELAMGAAGSLAGLFTDIRMGGAMDGIALAHIARARNPDAAIVVVSSQQTPRIGDMPGGARFMTKPYDNLAVLRAFGEMLHATH